MRPLKPLTKCASVTLLCGVFFLLFDFTSTALTALCTLSENHVTTPSPTERVLDEIVTDQVIRSSTPANYTKAEDTLTDSEEKTEGPTKECLNCLCLTVSGCKPVKCANQPPCGIYAISKWYWADVGKLKTTAHLNDYTEEDEEFRDYLRCVNDEQCATATVKNYLQIYSRDCNGDGKIDCEDYIGLHLYGPTGCRTEPLRTLRKMRMQKCKL